MLSAPFLWIFLFTALSPILHTSHQCGPCSHSTYLKEVGGYNFLNFSQGLWQNSVPFVARAEVILFLLLLLPRNLIVTLDLLKASLPDSLYFLPSLTLELLSVFIVLMHDPFSSLACKIFGYLQFLPLKCPTTISPLVFSLPIVYHRPLLHYYSHEHILRPLLQGHLFILWFDITCFFCPFLPIITSVTTPSNHTRLCRWPYFLMHSEDSVCQHSVYPRVPIFIPLHSILRVRWAQRPIEPHGPFDSCLLSSSGPSSITLPLSCMSFTSLLLLLAYKSLLLNIRCYYVPDIISGTQNTR